MKKTKAGTSVWLMISVSVLVTASWAAGPQQVIESRQANYREMGGAFKGIRDEIRKKQPLKIMLRQHADQLHMLTHSQAHADWFPRGSGPESGIETDALPVIWQQRAEFDRLRQALNDHAKKMVAVVAEGETKAIASHYRVLGGVCKQCHDSYRVEQD